MTTVIISEKFNRKICYLSSKVTSENVNEANNFTFWLLFAHGVLSKHILVKIP